MVNPKSKAKVAKQVSAAKKNLRDLTGGANKKLKDVYGEKYLKNTKKADKLLKKK